ncbi:MAG: DUF1508 domain-containing protein [Saprospiraceae bacterium]|jgi:uncharacterized protein YegP (UPF0339 family)|nr:DUF1508 domain-containing protein [Saprospiraceae bacterium]MBL0294581.1 DUF1508 domain-containing protein [Saprospiraceae bacterium]
MNFEIFKERDGSFRFRLISSGQEIIKSETYTNKANCKNGISSVKSNGISKNSYDIQETHKHKYYFNIKAKNGQIVASSVNFDQLKEAENWVKVLQKSLSDIEL